MSDNNGDKLGIVAKVFVIILFLGAAAHWVAAMLGQWWLGWPMEAVNDNRVSACVLTVVALLIWTRKKKWNL